MQRQWDRCRPGIADHRLVDREARVRVDHLVARLASREHTEEEERLRTRRDQHATRLDGHAACSREIVGRRLAQDRQPGSGAVVRQPVPQRLHASFDDVCWRVEIGLPDLQVDDLAALSLERLRAREHLKSRLCPQTALTRR